MANRVIHGTIATGGVAQNATLSHLFPQIEVLNRGTDFLYVRTDGVAAQVAGDECDVVPPSSSIHLVLTAIANYDQGNPTTALPANTTISVISATAGLPFSLTGEGGT